MKILIVNQYAVPSASGGGTRHVDLAACWAQTGHRVHLIASRFNHFARGPRRRLPRSTAITDGVTLRALRSPGYRGNGALRALDMVWFAVHACFATLFASRPDVILGSSPQPLATFGALVAAKLRGIPFILEIRDLWPQTLVDLGGIREEGLVARALYRLEALLVSSSHAVVGLPPATEKYLSDRGLARPARLEHIPNGSALDEVVGASAEALSRHGVAAGGFFAYAGSLGPANGVDALIRAMGTSRTSAALLIMGDGPERDRLRDLARSTPDANVIFTGQLDKRTALSVLGSSLANVFHLVEAPVFRYGLSPNKLIDYLASGRPLVYAGPRVPNPASQSGVAVEAVPNDAGSIARALERIESMTEQERAHLGQEGRAFAVAHHRTADLAARYVRLFEDCRRARVPTDRKGLRRSAPADDAPQHP